MQSDDAPGGGRTTALWLSMLVAGLAVASAWTYALDFSGSDFYLHWCVAHEIDAAEVGSIYTDDGARRLGQRNARRAVVAGASAHLPKLHSQYPTPTIWGTPFLYACFAGFVSEDYDADLFRYRLVTLACVLFAVVSFARFFGLGSVASCLAFAVLTWNFEPFLSADRTSNVSQLQLAVLAAYLWIHSDSRHAARDLGGGLVLGLAVAFKPNLAFSAALAVVARLVAREFRAAGWSAAGIAGGLAAGVATGVLAFAAPDAWTDWWRHLGAFLEAPPPADLGNFALASLLRPHLGFAPSTLLLLAATALACVVLWRRRTDGSARERDAVAVALGCVVTLLGFPVAWLHYYLLAIPLIVYCWRPTAGALGPLRIGATCVCVLGLALYPAIRFLGVNDSHSWALLCCGSTAGVFAVACLVRR